MCGILGVVGGVRSRDRIEGALELIHHRGPDAGGVHEIRPGTTFAFRRLSIIDLSAEANQPFSKHGKWIVYNGELYNYRQLRAELESEGARFRTASDTEVLLEAWHRWGENALRRLRGMFAFAVADEQTGTVHLVRDHFGIKPLYLAETSEGVVFGSELKAVLPLLEPAPSVDPLGLAGALVYYWLPEPLTMYRGVRKVPAGTVVEIRPDGTVDERRWWDPRELLEPAEPPTDRELREIIEESVRAHLVADVPVGVFLSGGLDSSLITAIAAREIDDLQAFTIGFRDADLRFEAMPDDLAYARRFAADLGITLHEITIEPDLTETLPQMVATLDEPIGDAAALNTRLICRDARERGMKVLLSGMGADEFFAGYRKHQAALVAARYRKVVPASVHSALVAPMVGRLPVASATRGFRYSRWLHRFAEFASLDEEAAFQRSYSMHGLDRLRDLVDPELHRPIDEILAAHREVYWEAAHADHVNRMCYTDLRLFLPSLNLAYTDRASMSESVEVRVPYVDVEVAKAAFAIPGSRKIRRNRRKIPLQEAARGWVPDEIVDRPKGLFSAPLRSWMRGDLAPMIDEQLVQGELVSAGVLRSAALEALVNDDRSGAADNAKELWQLLTLELWYRAAGRVESSAP